MHSLGDNILLAADTERSTSSTTPVEYKKFVVGASGYYRIKYERKVTSGTGKLDIYYGASVSQTTFTGADYEEVTFDIPNSLSNGNFIRIYLHHQQGTGTTYIKNVRLCVKYSNTVSLLLD